MLVSKIYYIVVNLFTFLRDSERDMSIFFLLIIIIVIITIKNVVMINMMMMIIVKSL